MEEKINYEISAVVCDEAVTQEVYLQVGFKTSLCVLILNTGFEAIGSYSPIDAQDFNIAIGKEESRKKAVEEAVKHLSAINQWRKAVADSKAAEKAAKEESQNMAGPSDTSNDPEPSTENSLIDKKP